MWSSSQNIFLNELRLNFLNFPSLHNSFTCFQMLFKVLDECHLRSFIDDVHFGYITKLKKTWLPRNFLQWYYIFQQYKLYPNLVKIVHSVSLHNTSVCQYWKCVCGAFRVYTIGSKPTLQMLILSNLGERL
jgi:hypothetical protein